MSLRRKPLFVIISVKHHVVFTKSRSERVATLYVSDNLTFVIIGDVHSFCSGVLASGRMGGARGSVPGSDASDTTAMCRLNG